MYFWRLQPAGHKLFKTSKLEDAFFFRVNIFKVEFLKAELKNLTFNESEFSQTSFTECIIEGCNFSNTKFRKSNFPNSTFGLNYGLAGFKGVELDSIQISQLAESLALEVGIRQIQ